MCGVRVNEKFGRDLERGRDGGPGPCSGRGPGDGGR